MKDILVVGIGEVLWDVFPDRKVMGGAPANFAHHASQLGLNGYVVSAIGNDALGEQILENLRTQNLNYIIEETNYPTGIVEVSLSGNGIPQYEILENVAWDNIPFSKEIENLAKRTTTVCFGSLAQRGNVSKSTIRKFLNAMPTDSLRIFDINLRQNFYTKDLIEESFLLANILKINDEEVEIVAQLFGETIFNEEEFCKMLLSKYKLKILILTKGTKGSFVFSEDQVSFLPTPNVIVADTVGAGDSFTAGFTAGYLKGLSIAEAHKLAIELSAYVCSQHGAMPILPDVYRELL